MYAASQAEGAPGASAEAGADKKDDVIDADFQEVDEKDQKKRA
jgi:molecular chaperone DnaK